MNEVYNQALQISILGVGLVFLGILMLWGMMELVVLLTAPKKPKTLPGKPEKPTRDFVEARRKAAAAAVITAMALQNTAFTASSHRKREAITPWQTAYRSHQLRSAIAANNRRKKDR
jgi:Na+-transporting methylmalonyl-CoA/oxaloacetate decarboxylase gamma subunit